MRVILFRFVRGMASILCGTAMDGWAENGSFLKPVSGHVLEATEVVPVDVLARVGLVRKELDLLRKEVGAPVSMQSHVLVTGVTPREVFFQALSLYRNADRLAFEHMGTMVDEPELVPPDEITPLHVLYVVESEEGRGSTFALLLPVRACVKEARFGLSSSTLVPANVSLSGSPHVYTFVREDGHGRDGGGENVFLPAPEFSFQRKTGLVVDDDMRNLFALTGILEAQGMRVLTAKNRREALERLQEDSGVDIVFMDIMMPEKDGDETIRTIRENPSWRNLPIIALTAKTMKGDRKKCIQAGATDCLPKPIEVGQLLAMIHGLLFCRKVQG